MRNLLTKALFISLLSSAVMPFDLQAGLFKFVKAAVAAGVAGGAVEALSIAAALSIAKNRDFGVKEAVGAGALGGAVGALITEDRISIEDSGVKVTVGTGVGAAAAVIGAAIVLVAKKRLAAKKGEGEIIGVLKPILILATGAGAGAAVGRVGGEPIGLLGQKLALKLGAAERIALSIKAVGTALGMRLGAEKGIVIAKMLTK